MEIQDRNSLLKMFFSSKENSIVSTDSASNGFAEMLQAQQTEDSAKSTETVFKIADSAKNNVSVKENEKPPLKKDIEANEQASASEKTSKPAKKDKPKKEDDVNEEKNVVEADKTQEEAPKHVEKNEEISDADETQVSAEEAPATDVSLEEAAVVAPLVPVMSLVEDAPVEEMVAQPLVEEVVPVSETPLLTEAVEMVVADKTYIKQIENGDETALMQPLTEEEGLLLEQAKFLDEKVGAENKIKIEVNVKEEKIADTLTKDVLQNRFVIDSVFQNIDTEQAVVDMETQPVTDIDVLSQNDTTDTISSSSPKMVAVAENQITPENVVKTATTDAQVLSVSGKEVVFDNANSVKAETFAKLNETSSRDVFKGMGKEVVEQIKVNITKSAIKGVDTIDIQLKPEDLGKVQIKMYIAKDGKLQADIIAARQETMDILQKDISGLTKAFNDAGFETDSRSFNFSFQNENQTREQQNDDSALLKFIGDTLEQEAETIAGNDNLGYDPVLGLNIRV